MALNSSLRVSAAFENLKQRRFDAAEEELLALLSQEPENLAAQTLLAVTYFRTNRAEQAEPLLIAVLQKQPTHADALGLLAVLRLSQRDFSRAAELFQRLIDLGRQSVDIYGQLGSCRLEMGDAIGAGAAFRRAIELDRNHARSYYNLGKALQLGGSSYETFITFKRAIQLDPDFEESYLELWEAMSQLLNWKEGLSIMEDGFRRHPHSIPLTVKLASTYGKVGRATEAERLFKEAATVNPSVDLAYAYWLQEEGRFEDSVPILKGAILRDPKHGQGFYKLAVAKCFEIEGKPFRDLIPSFLEDNSIGGEERMFLHFALAKTYDHESKYELAMRSYDLANDLAYRLYNSEVNLEEYAAEFEYSALIRLYPKGAIEELARYGSKSSVPIFIVGMIRTGTTLLDQILSSHPQVKSAGEQPFWRVSAGRVNRRWMESGRDHADFKDLERRYLGALEDATGGASRITDKMPTNFIHMGLMSAVFPNAKFIHTRRSPLDTCLSVYTTFLGNRTQFAYHQENIVAYYREYLRVMDHWRSTLPRGQMIEIDYEELVTDKERVLREVLEFCGLEWDDACLSHEQNVSQVSTPSLWTARQPVNAASVERWRKYEPWLGRLLELKDIRHPTLVGEGQSDLSQEARPSANS